MHWRLFLSVPCTQQQADAYHRLLPLVNGAIEAAAGRKRVVFIEVAEENHCALHFVVASLHMIGYHHAHHDEDELTIIVPLRGV